MLGGGLYQRLVQLHRLLHLLGGDFQYIGHASFRLPAIHLHFQHIHHGVERGAARNRILYLYHLTAPTIPQLGDRAIVIRLIVIQLVDNENHRFMELLRVTELVDGTYLHAILGIQHHQSRIGHVQGRDSASHEIVRTRAIDEIQLSTLPFHTENGREYRVTILLLNREIIAHRIS